jgi:Zn-finger in ubiquitin-hydrolases and other protein
MGAGGCTCGDNSLGKHATAHAQSSGHPVIRSFEPGEDWFWNYRTDDYMNGPELAPPEHHPLDQPVPGPAGRVPGDWQQQLTAS